MLPPQGSRVSELFSSLIQRPEDEELLEEEDEAEPPA